MIRRPNNLNWFLGIWSSSNSTPSPQEGASSPLSYFTLCMLDTLFPPAVPWDPVLESHQQDRWQEKILTIANTKSWSNFHDGIHIVPPWFGGRWSIGGSFSAPCHRCDIPVNGANTLVLLCTVNTVVSGQSWVIAQGFHLFWSLPWDQFASDCSSWDYHGHFDLNCNWVFGLNV